MPTIPPFLLNKLNEVLQDVSPDKLRLARLDNNARSQVIQALHITTEYLLPRPTIRTYFDKHVASL